MDDGPLRETIFTCVYFFIWEKSLSIFLEGTFSRVPDKMHISINTL
jgi:hypothetical protein